MALGVSILFFLLFPVLILKAQARLPFLEMIGPVILAYACGILLAQWSALDALKSAGITVSEAAVPLAIPLLLFGQNLWQRLNSARVMLLSFVIAVISTGGVALVVGRYYASLPNSAEMAGMLAGVYTGGTPNMASIGLAVAADHGLFVLLNSVDVVLSGLYLLIFMAGVKRFYQPVPEPEETDLDQAFSPEQAPPLSVLQILAALGLSALIVVASVGLSLLITGKISVPLVMLALTALGLAASFWPRVHRLRASYPTGEYLILVFCLAIGAQVDLGKMIALFSEAGSVMVFCFCIISGSIVLHLSLARLFRLPWGETLMASTAAVFGPPFVGVAAQTLRQPSLIAPGLAVGVLGYAVGNYLGLGVYYLLQYWGL